jgi:hypothetical protein
MVLKQKAADDMKRLNEKFIEYQSKRESEENQAKVSKYTADLNFRSEQLRANTSRLDRLASRATAEESRAFGQYQAAVNQEQRVISKITDQSKLLAEDYETIRTAEMNAKQNDGKMTPSIVPKYEAAKKKIEEQEKIWNKQKEDAAKNTDLAYSRVSIKPEAPATTTPAPANAPQNRVPLNDASLQK